MSELFTHFSSRRFFKDRDARLKFDKIQIKNPGAADFLFIYLSPPKYPNSTFINHSQSDLTNAVIVV